MIQLIPFDTSKGGNIPNFCLDNVRRGYSIANKYGSAWEAWLHTQQHADRNFPAGLDIPLYYSYTTTLDGVTKNYGHINVRLANGTVWSDGKIYANLDSYLINHFPKFVGWGESVNDFKIIGEDMSDIFNDGDAQNLTDSLLGGGKPPSWITQFIDGQTTYKRANEQLLATPEYLAFSRINDGDLINNLNILGWPKELGVLGWTMRRYWNDYASNKIRLEHEATPPSQDFEQIGTINGVPVYGKKT